MSCCSNSAKPGARVLLNSGAVIRAYTLAAVQLLWSPFLHFLMLSKSYLTWLYFARRSSAIEKQLRYSCGSQGISLQSLAMGTFGVLAPASALVVSLAEVPGGSSTPTCARTCRG